MINLIKNEPVVITDMIRNILLVLILFSILKWDQTELAGVLLAFGSVLTAVQRALSTPTAKVEADKKEFVDSLEAIAAQAPPARRTKG